MDADPYQPPDARLPATSHTRGWPEWVAFPAGIVAWLTSVPILVDMEFSGYWRPILVIASVYGGIFALIALVVGWRCRGNFAGQWFLLMSGAAAAVIALGLTFGPGLGIVEVFGRFPFVTAAAVSLLVLYLVGWRRHH